MFLLDTVFINVFLAPPNLPKGEETWFDTFMVRLAKALSFGEGLGEAFLFELQGLVLCKWLKPPTYTNKFSVTVCPSSILIIR